MKKSILSLLFAFIGILNVNAESIECLIYWNGSQSSIVSPFGSSYAKGVSVRINNNTESPFTIISIEIKLNNVSLGYLNIDNPTISPYSSSTISFNLTNRNQMPYILPSAVIKYEYNGETNEIEVFNTSVITAINASRINNDINYSYYDLSGKLVEKPLKGNIYIYNGKKILY